MSIEIKLEYVYALHAEVLSVSGGSPGIRDFNGLDSALAQPNMSWDGQDFYPTVAEKAAALAYSLVQNHPFVDGNKRVGHGLMVLFLNLSGFNIEATIDDQEATFLSLAAGNTSREELVAWIQSHIVPIP